MNKPLFLFVGRSASGKTTIADILVQNHNHKQVYSYTTRLPRHENEIGHVFINEDEFDELKDLVAYTKYNGYRYGTTAQQLDECSIYVVDVPGVKTLLENYNTNRPICIIYFNANVYSRINRMLDRGDSDMMIISRLLTDEKEDWWDKLDAIVWQHKCIAGKNVRAYSINSNDNTQDVLKRVLYYIKETVEEK